MDPFKKSSVLWNLPKCSLEFAIKYAYIFNPGDFLKIRIVDFFDR